MKCVFFIRVVVKMSACAAEKGVLRWRSLCKFCRKSLHFILSCTKLGHSSSFSIQNSRPEGILVRKNLNLPPILRSTTSNELLNGSFDVVLLKIGGRFKFFYTQNRLGCVFVCLNVIRMSIFLQIDTIIQKLQRYLHKVRHRNTPFWVGVKT